MTDPEEPEDDYFTPFFDEEIVVEDDGDEAPVDTEIEAG